MRNLNNCRSPFEILANSAFLASKSSIYCRSPFEIPYGVGVHSVVQPILDCRSPFEIPKELLNDYEPLTLILQLPFSF